MSGQIGVKLPPDRNAGGPMMKPMRIRLLTILAATLMVAGCALPGQRVPEAPAFSLANHGRLIAGSIDICRALLNGPKTGKGLELDSARIQLFNWNIQKALHGELLEDLDHFTQDSDLVLIQEAAFRDGMLDSLRDDHYWSFAPGYMSGEISTGVMTVSRSAPLAQCNLTNYEPWLGTPKATIITQYGLSGTDETLIVVNIHAINFTVGMKEFRKQLAEVLEVVSEHDGPMIFGGDFNTWRPGRMRAVNQTIEKLGLSPLEFTEDHRITTFGQHLDHIYLRGLQVETATSSDVESSDHNPMSVRLRL